MADIVFLGWTGYALEFAIRGVTYSYRNYDRHYADEISRMSRRAPGRALNTVKRACPLVEDSWILSMMNEKEERYTNNNQGGKQS